MEKTESIEEFYKRKYNSIPDSLLRDIGHFNVFEHQLVEPGKSRPVPYKRRDFYKVMYVKGNVVMNYADKTIEVQRQALFFSNPTIPYNCSNLEVITEGYYCIFDANFFRNYGSLDQYAVFQPGGNRVFELTDEQAATVKPIFLKMFEEIQSDYEHKYDVLRNYVYELLHLALKTQPASSLQQKEINAAQRISALFLELLERQFPIEESHPRVQFRTAADFAGQLNVHVNHLNRALKETTSKSTSEIIGERLLQESKILLKHSHANVSEIAYALGFNEATHFNNFFKKHLGLSPNKFRKSV